MEQQLAWRKEVFNSHYQLYVNGEIKGSLLFNNWSNSARGIARKNYYFLTQGYFNPVTIIRDENFSKIGEIHYHFWKLKSSVHLHTDQHAFWSFSNGRLSQWSITRHTEQVRYQAKTGSGLIYSNTEDELLLLTGIYIREFFSRTLITLLMLILIALLIKQL